MIAAIMVAAFSTGTLLVMGLLAESAPIDRLAPLGARQAPSGWLASKWNRWAAFVSQACLPVSPAAFTRASVAIVLGAGILGWLLMPWQIGVAISVLAAVGIRLYLQRRIRERGRYVAAELPAFLRLVIGRIRTGFSLLQALEMAAHEGPPQLAAEMQRAIAEVNLGTPLETALARVAERLRHEDIDLVMTALIIGREIGGNLSETLAALAETVASRAILRRQVRVLTAQPRFSGWIVGVLPFLILGLMTILNPKFTLIMVQTTTGLLILGLGLISEAVGILVIRRILRAGEELLS